MLGKVLIGSILMVLAVPAGAVDYYVDASRPDDTGDGLSWLTAKRTIQGGVDAATIGDTVWVTNGYYMEGGAPESGGYTLTNLVFADKTVTIRSVNGRDVTVIKGPDIQGVDAKRGVFLSSGAVMEGFTIEDCGTFSITGDSGHEQYGGGAWVDTNSILRSCKVRWCTAEWGAAGVYLFPGGLVEDCTIEYNEAMNSGSEGGGVQANSGGLVQFCDIKENKAAYAGGISLSGDAMVRSSLISGNDATIDGGGIRLWDSAHVVDCMVIYNTATNDAGGILFYIGGRVTGCTVVDNFVTGNGGGVAYFMHGQMENSIVWSNAADTAWSDIYIGSANATNINVCAFDGVVTGVDGCINSDPEFMNPWTDDFRLSPGSMCYNAGNNTFMASTSDFAGNPRQMFGVVDMGALERQYQMTAYSGPADGGNVVVITNGLLGSGLDIESVLVCGIPAVINDQGTDWVEITLGDAGGGIGVLRGDVVIHSVSQGKKVFQDAYTYEFTTNTIYYVDASKTDDTGDGLSWNTAKRTLQAGVDLAADGEYVLVKMGTYNEGGAVTGGSTLTNRVCIEAAVQVIAVDGPEWTEIIGAGPLSPEAVRGAYVGAGALLDGFLIRDGYSRETGGAPYEDQCGGGVLVASGGAVKNCVVESCFAATDGGGALVRGVMDHSMIKSNVNPNVRGGGVCVSDGGTLRGCIVSENEGIGSVYMRAAGGASAVNLLVVNNVAGNAEPAGVLIESDSVNPQRYLLNCTIADNVGDATGVEGANIIRGQYQNCIIYDNLTDTLGDSIYSNCCLPTLSGVTGGNNGTNDPYFTDLLMGNFHLASASWCVGAGDVNALTNEWSNLEEAVDLEGARRVQRQQTDMGCFQYPQGPNNALRFDGTSQYVDLGLRLGGLSALTTEAWIYLDYPNGSNRLAHICSKEHDSQLYLYGNRLQFNIGDGASWGPVITSVRTLDTGVWYHVAAVWDSASTMGYLYIDGVPESTGALANYMGFSGYNRYIGATDTGSNAFIDTYFPGRIDEVRLWTTNRSLVEIQQDMFISLDGNEPGLAAYFRMNQLGGDRVVDYSLNRWDGRLGSTIDHGKLAEWMDSDAVISDTEMRTAANVGAVWQAESTSSLMAGHGMEAQAVLWRNTNRVVAGHDGGTGMSALDLPSDVSNRLSRIWYCDVAGGVVGSQVYTLSDAQWGGGSNVPPAEFALLHRLGTTGAFATVVSNASAVVGEVITFNGVSFEQGYYTLGLRNEAGFELFSADGANIADNESPSSVKGTEYNLQRAGVAMNHSFVITNRGAAVLEISNVTTGGAQPEAFAVTAVPAVINPHDSAVMTVSYNPMFGGAHSAQLVVENNSATTSFVLNVAGEAFQVTPSNGPAAGGQSVSIVAGELGDGSDISSVTVCGYTAVIGTQGTNWVNVITGTGPAPGVLGDIFIHSDNLGSTTLTNAYRYNPAGSITTVSPSSGSVTGGYPVVIDGLGLSDGTTGDVISVTINGAAVSSVDAVYGTTQVVVTAASSLAGAGDVVVDSYSHGTTIASNAFTYLDPAFMQCSPLVLNYGSSYGGTVPASQTAVLSNIGDMPMFFTNIMEYGGGASDWFSLHPDNGSIPAGSSVTMTGVVNQTGIHPGTYVMTNRFTSVDAANSPFDLVVTYTMARGDQTITFPTISDQYVTDTVGLSAVSDSGLTVAFTVLSGPGVISGQTNLSFVGTGVVSIEASQPGDSDWNAAAPVTNSFNVLPTPATDYTWTGAEDDVWTNGNNWSDGVVPVFSNRVHFVTSTGSTVRSYIHLPGDQSIEGAEFGGGHAAITFKAGGRLLMTNGTSSLSVSSGGAVFYCPLVLGNSWILSNETESLIFPANKISAQGELTKQGEGLLMLGRSNYFGGNLWIDDGGLRTMGDIQLAANSMVRIGMNAQLASAASRSGGAGTVHVTNEVSGSIAAEIYGELVVRILRAGHDTFAFGQNALQINAGSVLKVDDGSFSPTGRYVVATYDSLIGTFSVFTGLPSHTVQYGANAITLEPRVTVDGGGSSGSIDASKTVHLDYDGDKKADVAVFWPEEGTWYILESATMAARVETWGWAECIPVVGDFDGDGKCDMTVYSGDFGAWYTYLSKSGRPLVRNWGWAEAVPVAGDYDGDGITDMAVYSAQQGEWCIWQSKTDTPRVQAWGGGEALPVPSDYDGDGLADVAVYNPVNGTWYILQSSDESARVQAWGWAAAQPQPGDYDGDGRADIAVYWPDEGWWNVLCSADGSTFTRNWGCMSMQAVPADYDGDGLWDTAVYQGDVGVWNIWQSGSESGRVQTWGMGDADPIVLSY